VIEPKIGLNIQAVEAKIQKTREGMKQEFLTTKKSLSETQGYKLQQEQIKQRDQLQSMQMTIRNITLDGKVVQQDISAQQVLRSLQKTPEWQKIIQ
jgi:hypothetical protein